MEFPSSDACLEDLRHAKDHAKDTKNSNKVISVDSYTLYSSPLFTFLRLQILIVGEHREEQIKPALKTNQLVPAEIDVCSSKW